MGIIKLDNSIIQNVDNVKEKVNFSKKEIGIPISRDVSVKVSNIIVKFTFLENL